MTGARSSVLKAAKPVTTTRARRTIIIPFESAMMRPSIPSFDVLLKNHARTSITNNCIQKSHFFNCRIAKRYLQKIKTNQGVVNISTVLRLNVLSAKSSKGIIMVNEIKKLVEYSISSDGCCH